MLPLTAPHEEIDSTYITFDNISNYYNWGGPLIVRYTTDFDCGYETNWWYCIKDSPFDIALLTSKRRNIIARGKREFLVIEIDPTRYKNEIYEVQIASFTAYPEKYRPTVNRESFLDGIDSWVDSKVFGAFYRPTGELCGYSKLMVNNSFASFQVQKTKPAFERLQVNAALVAGILEYLTPYFDSHFYLCDGERNILHETEFQNYLEKYFGFRKAYCKLHVIYRKDVAIAVRVLYPLRKWVQKLNNFNFVHRINGLLHMEEIVRSQL